MPIACAGILIEAPGPRYLLLRRNDRNEWEGPGGHIEPGETPEEAARRECREEIGWKPTGKLTEIDRNQHKDVDYTLFLCRVRREFRPSALNHEHDRYGWFDADDLPSGTHPKLRQVIEHAQLQAATWTTAKPYQLPDLPEFNDAQFNPRAQPFYDRHVRLSDRQGGKITVDHLEELADQGMPEEAIDAATVPTSVRDRLPSSAFAVPGKRKLLITDEKHTRLAWDMVTRTQGLTSEERAEARRRILRRAHQLGISTDGWNVHAASVELQIEAMSLMVPDIKGHPNRHPFSGIVTRIGVPSDKAPGGSAGKRVILTPEAVKHAIPSILGMGVDYSHDFRGHDPQRKIGVITGAKEKGNALHIEGFFYAADFPEVVQEIVQNKRALGWSYEVLVADGGAQHAEDLLIVTEFVFTGAAVLRKDAAAYSTTTLAAATEDSDMAEYDHKADEKVMDEVKALKKRIDELEKSQEEDMREDRARMRKAKRHEAAEDEDERGRRRKRAAEDEADDDGDGEEIDAKRRTCASEDDDDEDYEGEYVKARRRKVKAAASRSRSMRGHVRELRHRAMDIASKGLPEEAKELHDLADKIERGHFGEDTPDDAEYRDERGFYYDDPIAKPRGMEPAYDDLPDIHASGNRRPQRRSIAAGGAMTNPRFDGIGLQRSGNDSAAAIAALDAQLAASGISGQDSIKAKLAALRNAR
ncbi:MAG: NUDIX hydrolase [Acidithiobacillus ferriphilus]